jgi:integrase
MASLQARHTRKCATGKPWTPFALERMVGDDGAPCDCDPTYYVIVREGRKNHPEKVGKNRKTAERALTKIQGQENDNAYVPQKRIRFEVWGPRWLDSLERKRNTRRGYTSTITHAIAAFGRKETRRIDVTDVKLMLVAMREAGLSDSTRAKHLRVLGACFESAIAAGYAVRNPVRMLPKGEKPRATKKESAYFTRDELPRVFSKVEHGVHRVLFLVALKTGMRIGELSALTWGDVDLLNGVLRVRRTYTDGFLDEPKTHERRDVDLTTEVVDLLGEWWGELGEPGDDTLVFPGATKSGYLNPKVVLAELYDAMADAEVTVPRVGPTGEERTFHSFRHTFAKTALENSRSITWLQRQLGHKSITVTIDRYGHWERAARKLEAEALAGVFGV